MIYLILGGVPGLLVALALLGRLWKKRQERKLPLKHERPDRWRPL